MQKIVIMNLSFYERNKESIGSKNWDKEPIKTSDGVFVKEPRHLKEINKILNRVFVKDPR
jgi:hypothetical protein